MIVVKPTATLEWSTPDPALAIERAARTCYRSEGRIEPGSATALIRKLIARGHMAMLEHASASIRFVCDRGVSHEMVRHRLASYAQESTRYCNYAGERFGGEISVVAPPLTAGQIVAWVSACSVAETAYLSMLADGVAPQIARSVLPTCLRTEIVMTCNFREWMHFLGLRTAPAAHPQMREVAEMARQILVGVCPEVFGE